MNYSRMRLLGWFVLAALLLSGCASGYLLDNSVQSFSSLSALPAQPTYRFERLPSQQSVVQDQLEAMADPALLGAGLRRDDADARYTVQISVRLQRILSPWAGYWDGWGWNRWGWNGWGWGGWGGSFRHPYAFTHFNAFGRWESPWEHREVSVIVRELESNRVVFESHAVNEGPWLDNSSVVPAMFQAALQGFPNPPAGSRRVDIQLGS
jgi:hypothetical protein